jgi:23S rRNA pseudouridine1911/1915/1917 synthase
MEIDHFRQRILFEDNHLIIINKLAGEIVQGDITGDLSLLEMVKAYLKEAYNKPGNVFAGLVHRIDRPVSGAVIFTRTGKALSRMSALLKERRIEKTYWAVVANLPEPASASLEHYLVRNEKLNKTFVASRDHPEAKPALLDYTLIASSQRYHLLSIRLHTGRHHQIRAQLSAIGCPINGDLKYGAKRSNPDGSISLHARLLEFNHPVTGNRLRIEAAVPDELLPWRLFSEAR